MTRDQLVEQVALMLSIAPAQATRLCEEAARLYQGRMQSRFSELRVAERIKRTNPFLLRIRGVGTVRQWAERQVASAVISSEEEAVGHLLEAVAKICHPGARPPTFPNDFDYEVEGPNGVVAYQVKLSWDCMPMSSRKNLSNTIRQVRKRFKSTGRKFQGIFAPCYGKPTTTRPPGQEYVSMGSREFWTQVGSGDPDYDAKVGEVCSLLCSEFRATVERELLPKLIDDLTSAAQPMFGNPDGTIDYVKLFHKINP